VNLLQEHSFEYFPRAFFTLYYISLRRSCPVIAGRPINKSHGSVLVNNQLEVQFFFRICLLQFSIRFERPCAHHQENQLF
jgi:hypothetical protein